MTRLSNTFWLKYLISRSLISDVIYNADVAVSPTKDVI